MAVENRSSFVIELMAGMIALILYLSAFTMHRNYDYTPYINNDASQRSAIPDSMRMIEDQSEIKKQSVLDVNGTWFWQESGRWVITQSGTDLMVNVYNDDNTFASSGTGTIYKRRVTIKISDVNVTALVDVVLADDEQSLIGTFSVEGISGQASTIVLKR
ncbi:MAG: hypothetical protein LH473_02635 [Chitinophagales bacterium]|nr:hypothetical protein [Chitinophagales bacterium]